MASLSLVISPIFQYNSQISFARNRYRNFCSVYTATKLVRRDLLIGTLALHGGSKMSGIITTGEDSGESAATTAGEEVTLNPNNRVVELSEFPILLDSVVTVTVPRPRKSRTKAEKAEKEEALAIVGIEFLADKTVKFDVHVNDDVGSLSRPDKAEFAGSFCYLPHKRKVVTTSLRLGLTDLLEDVGADDDDSIKVTLVPKYVKRPVTIRQIRIEYLD